VTNEVYLDTSFAVAIAIVDDQYHTLAEALYDQMAAQAVKTVTSRAVLLEIGNSLSTKRRRNAGVRFLNFIEHDPSTRIISIDDALYARGLDLFVARQDKEWGLVDCLSFVVMRDLGLTEALTADHHFVQAGFRALLLEETTSS
jgi:predicted nucleic acid-binding protein